MLKAGETFTVEGVYDTSKGVQRKKPWWVFWRRQADYPIDYPLKAFIVVSMGDGNG